MKNCLIIGASSGIGRALAQQLADDGVQVIGTYNKTVVEDSDNIRYHQLDITQAEELDLSFAPQQLDGLVYCPGNLQLKPFARISPADFRSDFELQVMGAIRVLQGVLPNLKRSAAASIVFYSTVAAKLGFNFHTQVATSKGAIEGLAISLAAELAPTIRVNCIAPSLTDTPLAAKLLSSEEKKDAHAKNHPLKMIGQAEDIAAMTTFLLSEKAKWITGQILHVDGGMSSLKL